MTWPFLSGSVPLQLDVIGSERKIPVLAAVLIDEPDADPVVAVSQPAVNLPDMPLNRGKCEFLPRQIFFIEPAEFERLVSASGLRPLLQVAAKDQVRLCHMQDGADASMDSPTQT